jgi:UDP-N-acetylmuramate--alanine ligase
VLCVDDPNVREILPFVSKPVTTYGFAEDAQVRAINARAVDGRCISPCCAATAAEPPLDMVLNLPGLHNVQNALAAIAIATELEVPDAAIARRCCRVQRRGPPLPALWRSGAPDGGGTFTLVDDYGHHPVEMAATLAAARGAFPGRRLVLAFQPHRYTRTRDCFEDFVKVLGTADALLLAEVYAAGEAPIVAADGRAGARCAWPARSNRFSSSRSKTCRSPS